MSGYFTPWPGRREVLFAERVCLLRGVCWTCSSLRAVAVTPITHHPSCPFFRPTGVSFTPFPFQLLSICREYVTAIRIKAAVAETKDTVRKEKSVAKHTLAVQAV